ncbi:MAG: transposase [Acidimicrobiia bacterium]|nr:transposase [Acidimicrobiia bacterium]
MYNALLESWKGTYARWREHNPGDDRGFPPELNRSRYDLFKMFTQVRGEDVRWTGLDARVGRGVICRFDRATKAFYDRCKTGKAPGYPRFKSRHRWRSIEIPDASASMLSEPGEGRWWRLRVKGVPAVRFADRHGRLRSALNNGALVELRIVRTPLRVELHAVFRHPHIPDPTGEPMNPVGADKGLAGRLVLSDGTIVTARTPDLADIKRRQRALSRAKRGSRSRVKKRNALAKAWRRESERARQADFRLAHRLVSSYDGIAVEDLNVAGSSGPAGSRRRCRNSGGTPSISYWNTKPRKLVSGI